MASGNDANYEWTVDDVRHLDNKLAKMNTDISTVKQEVRSGIKEVKSDVKDVKDILQNNNKHIVVNPKDDFKDRIGVIIAVVISVISGIGYAISLITQGLK